MPANQSLVVGICEVIHSQVSGFPFLFRNDAPDTFWVSQRMAIGNKLVAVSQKDMDDSVPATPMSPLSIREAGIRSLIRQRTSEDCQPAAARPRTYHTASPQGEHEWAAAENPSTEEDGCAIAVTHTPSLPDMQCGPCTESCMPTSNPCMQQQELDSSAAADKTVRCEERDTAAVSSEGSSSKVEGADGSECEPEGMPKLLQRPQLQRPQLSSCHQVSADDQSQARSSDGFVVVDSSSRIKAAAPHYALAMQSEQQQVADSRPHEQAAMPLGHLLCLWAIKLVLPHPVTQKTLKLSIPDPPVFEQVRAAEARLARQANNTERD